MKKIGGINMEMATKLRGKIIRKKSYNVYDALKQSLKEVKLIKEGKIKTKTWQEILEELEKEKE